MVMDTKTDEEVEKEAALMEEVAGEVKAAINKIENEGTLEDILLQTHGMLWPEAVKEYQQEGESERDTVIRKIVDGIFGRHEHKAIDWT